MKSKNKQLIRNGFSESALLIRYRNGDEEIFREVVNRYGQSLYSFLQRFFDQPEVVEYVFQETFLQLYTCQDSIDANLPLKPRLLTIAANKAKDALQHMQHRSTVTSVRGKRP